MIIVTRDFGHCFPIHNNKKGYKYIELKILYCIYVLKDIYSSTIMIILIFILFKVECQIRKAGQMEDVYSKQNFKTN